MRPAPAGRGVAEGPIRLTGGEWRGTRLFSPPGLTARPALARVRTALFGTLGDLAGASVLDLFAGTGALGFEALSRGAAEAWFFERDAACVEAIRRSADKLRAGGRVQVVEGALPASLREAAGRGADVAFVDPPYATVDKPDAREPFLRLLSALASTGSLRPGALVVVEHREGSVPGAPAELEADETRVYGQTALSYYRVRK